VGVGVFQKQGQSRDEILSIFIREKDFGSRHPANNDLLRKAGNIDAGLRGHVKSLAGFMDFQGCPPFPHFSRNHSGRNPRPFLINFSLFFVNMLYIFCALIVVLQVLPSILQARQEARVERERKLAEVAVEPAPRE